MLIPSNKSQDHKIKEENQGFYHVEITRKTLNVEKERYDIVKTVSIFDKKGYEQFKNFMPAGISEAKVIHAPVRKRIVKKKEPSS